VSDGSRHDEPRDETPEEPRPVARDGGEAPSPPGATADDPAAMSFLDHLDELRSVLVHSLIAAAVATILCWFWSASLLDLLVRPIQEHGIYFTAPNEAFLTRLKLAAIVGVFLVLPFILFRVYGFVLPGLYGKERRVITPLLVSTTLLFYLGVAFSFLVVTPAVVTFLLSFGTSLMQPLIGIGPYFAFVARLSLAFGLIFELPVLVFFLSVIGVVDPRWLLKTWRYALVVIVTLSAILTPPDIFSQLAMAGPVTLLYICSVLVAMAATRKRRQAADLAQRSADDAGDEPED